MTAFTQKFPWIDKRNEGRNRRVLGVEQSGKWSQQACTTILFLVPKNVTSERPIALMPTLIRLVGGFEGSGGGEGAAEVPC